MSIKIPERLAEALRLGRPLRSKRVALNAWQELSSSRSAMISIGKPSGKDGDGVISTAPIVVWREYSREHIEKGWDILQGNGMWELKQATVQGLDAVETLLDSWAVPVDKLTYLWKSTIPG
jgi:hypothetical protein